MNGESVPPTKTFPAGVLGPEIDRVRAAERNATLVQVFRAGGDASARTLKTYRPLKAIRLQCLDCSGSSPKSVLWCPADGVHSRRCHLWPYRFGIMPKTFAERHGLALVTPEMMPNADVNEDLLPNGVAAATAYLSKKRPE